jgi:hypothetical protein
MFKKLLKNNFITTSNKEDIRISMFIVSFFFISIINATIKTILNIPKVLYPLISLCFGIFTFFIILITIYPVIKRSLKMFMYMEILGITVYLISFLQGNAEISVLMKNAVWTLLVCIPMVAYIYSLKNKQIFYNMFLKASYIMSAILILSAILNDATYTMFFSYSILPITLFHINEWFAKYKNFHLFIFIFEISMIVLRGSRGALLCVAVFFIIKFLYLKIEIILKTTIISIGSLMVIVFVINFDKIGKFVLNYFNKIGYYSRTITLFFSGSITYDAGRSKLTEYYINLIKQKPVFGW